MNDVLDANRLRTIGLPGLILALAFHPFFAKWIASGASVYGLEATVIFVAEIVLFGLFISSAVRWIYYIYEGYRVAWITEPFRHVNSKLIYRRKSKQSKLYAGRRFNELSRSERRRATMLNEYLSDFYLDEDGKPLRPTRLANVIASYERYPERRYEVNGIEYWHHIINFAPDHLRKQLDDVVSIAQSLVLASAATLIVAISGVFLASGLAAGEHRVLVTVPVGYSTAIAYATLGIAGWIVFYRLAVVAHREVSSVFRAITDLAMPAFVAWLKTVQVPLTREDVTKAREVSYRLAFGVPPPPAGRA